MGKFIEMPCQWCAGWDENGPKKPPVTKWICINARHYHCSRCGACTTLLFNKVPGSKEIPKVKISGALSADE